MGNCPGCLSNVHGSSVHDDPSCAGDDAELITVVRSTDGELFKYPAPVFVKDLMSGFHGFAVFSYAHNRGTNKPLPPDTQLSFNTRYHLQPLFKPSLKLQSENMHDATHKLHLQNFASLQPQETPAAEIRSSKKPKISKKVRFADEPVLVSSCNQEIALSSSCNDELQSKELSHKKQSAVLLDGANRSRSSYAGVDNEITSALTRQGNSLNGVVRLKVIISKKDLTELMSPKITDIQVEAMVERIITPLLSPQHCSSTISCSQIS